MAPDVLLNDKTHTGQDSLQTGLGYCSHFAGTCTSFHMVKQWCSACVKLADDPMVPERALDNVSVFVMFYKEF